MAAHLPILLTGFEPFGAYTTNPSQQVIENFDPSLQGVQIEKAVLPVSYTETPKLLSCLLNETDWSAVICFGLHGGGGVRIETLGRNRNSSASADNDGLACLDQAVVFKGPDTLPVTLPTRKLLDALVAAGMPASLSDDAGGYLCNHTLYTLLYSLLREFDRGNDVIPAGFIHLPPLPEQSAKIGMALERQLQVVRIVVETVMQHLDTANGRVSAEQKAGNKSIRGGLCKAKPASIDAGHRVKLKT